MLVRKRAQARLGFHLRALAMQLCTLQNWYFWRMANTLLEKKPTYNRNYMVDEYTKTCDSHLKQVISYLRRLRARRVCRGTSQKRFENGLNSRDFRLAGFVGGSGILSCEMSIRGV